MAPSELLERTYAAIYEPEDARACRDIDADACSVVPGNFFRIVTTLALTKLGDALINPKTTLPWLLLLGGALWLIASVLFAIIHNGLRTGRKTYVVDLADESKRTAYVAVSNTVIGVLLLVAAAVSAVVSQWSPLLAIRLFALLAGIAASLALALPEVQPLALEN